jgi:hypothetical protein
LIGKANLHPLAFHTIEFTSPLTPHRFDPAVLAPVKSNIGRDGPASPQIAYNSPSMTAAVRSSSREEHLKLLDTVLSAAAAREAQKSLFPKDLATILLPPLANSLILKYLTSKSLFLKDLQN